MGFSKFEYLEGWVLIFYSQSAANDSSKLVLDAIRHKFDLLKVPIVHGQYLSTTSLNMLRRASLSSMTCVWAMP